MAAHIVKVPDIGEGIAEVELVQWEVQPGDTVVADQVLAEGGGAFADCGRGRCDYR